MMRRDGTNTKLDEVAVATSPAEPGNVISFLCKKQPQVPPFIIQARTISGLLYCVDFCVRYLSSSTFVGSSFISQSYGF